MLSLLVLTLVVLAKAHAAPNRDIGSLSPAINIPSKSFLEARSPFGLRSALEVGNAHDLNARQGGECPSGTVPCGSKCMRSGNKCCGSECTPWHPAYRAASGSCPAGSDCFSNGCCETGNVPCIATDGSGDEGCYPKASGAQCCSSGSTLDPNGADILTATIVLMGNIVWRAGGAVKMARCARVQCHLHSRTREAGLPTNLPGMPQPRPPPPPRPLWPQRVCSLPTRTLALALWAGRIQRLSIYTRRSNTPEPGGSSARVDVTRRTRPRCPRAL